MTYEQFLEKKRVRIAPSGFNVEVWQLNEALFPFQRYIVKKALEKGKYAVFSDCGTGKTIMQVEWANQVVKHTGRPVLIFTPLAVAGQKFIRQWKWVVRAWVSNLKRHTSKRQ